MATTQGQFEQRLAAMTEPWITRKQLEHLADVSAKTMRNWLAAHPIPAGKTRTGARSVQLIERDTAVEWARARLFSPKEGTAGMKSGPRLAAEVAPLPHAVGDRWRWTDIARLRGVTPGAVSNLARTYAEHQTHPFPAAEDDRKRDAAAVAAWFLWYDSERPGYSS